MTTTYEKAAWGGGNQVENTAQQQHDTTSGPSSGGAGILVTRITSTEPARLTKRFDIGPDDQLIKSAGGQLMEGLAEQVVIDDLHNLLVTLDDLSCSQAMAYGIAEAYPSARVVTTANHQDGDGCITRTRRYFGFRRAPGVMMLDHDATSAQYTPKELISTLRRVAPSLANAGMAWRASASSGIATENGKEINGLCGQRLYLLVRDAALIPEAGKALIDLCWANGLGRIEVGTAGQALERTVVDAMVWQPERLDFAAGPDLGRGLHRQVPEPFVNGDPSALFDLRKLIAEADQGVISKSTAARKQAREGMSQALAQAREAWVDLRAPKLSERQGISLDAAHDVLSAASQRYRLSLDFVLYTSDRQEVTVRELLDNPEQWHGTRFADPLEPDYHGDSRIAWANLRSGGQPYLYSHAHGGRRFDLMRATRRIQLRVGGRDQAVDETLDLLRDRGDLFEYGDSLARVTNDGASSASAKVVDQHWLLDHLDHAVDYYATLMREGAWVEQAKDAPLFVAQRILAKQGERRLPKLDAVITAPTLRSDGSLLNEPGYDHGSKLLMAANTPDLPFIPQAPTQDQAVRALEQLWSPFRHFPFVDAIDYGVILSAILTATVRASLPTAPGFGIDAPTAGSGKTLLAQAIGALTLGHKVPALPPAGNQDDESRKRLFAALRDGTRVLLWDNVRDPLGNASIDAFLTAPTFSDRVLGVSETLALPNRALFLTTGNSLRLVGDTCRRILIARIDPQIERPYAREFDFCPVETVISRRQELVAAALTLMRASLTAGRQRIGKGRTASFETWDDLVRQTVCWVATWDERFRDPLEATERAYEEDPQTTNLRNLLRAWHDVFGTKPVTVERLVDESGVSMGEPAEISAAKRDLQDALRAVAGDHRGINNRILGGWIAKNKERRIDGLRIVQQGNPDSKSRKSKLWCLGVDADQDRGVWGSLGVDSGSVENEREIDAVVSQHLPTRQPRHQPEAHAMR